MNVVYFAVGQDHAELAELSASVLRVTNPNAEVYVLTDLTTQFSTLRPVRGHVSPRTRIYDRTILQYQFILQHREALFLDSDCVVQKDLSGAFDGSICVTERVPPKSVPDQIYNGGVLYGSGHGGVAFWLHWCQLYWFIQRDLWAWYGDQVLLARMAKNYPLTIYGSSTHNFVPRREDEPNDAYIVHFKGEIRKAWMRNYARRLLDQRTEVAA